MRTNKVDIENGLLLDTHVWIWLNTGNTELATKTIDLIEAAGKEGKIFISAITIWEIATLNAKKRITLQTPLSEWIDDALNQPGVKLINMSPAIMIESAQLPNEFHGDPADRLIVATARIERMPIITRDRKILAYSHSGYVQACQA